jgi:hypothetical protein
MGIAEIATTAMASSIIAAASERTHNLINHSCAPSAQKGRNIRLATDWHAIPLDEGNMNHVTQTCPTLSVEFVATGSSYPLIPV